MKITITAVVLMLVFTACQKNEIFDSAQKNEVKGYELQLTQDYTQASLYHSALMPSTSTTTTTGTTTTTSTGSDGTDHASHHVKGLSKVNSAVIDYNKLMFIKNDSLFSEHYFQYCKYMLQNENSNMVVDSTGMMVNQTTTMGFGNSMVGSGMGNMGDKSKMIQLMDSMHLSLKNTINPDYMRNDSILHEHMVMCKMMSTQTDSIEGVYNKMTILRRNHKSL
ncbi:MAG: hypothetical protein VB066_01620 [Paludibacter sp.]|nr:hypothetical protein [Paludibacter sp.]